MPAREPGLERHVRACINLVRPDRFRRQPGKIDVDDVVRMLRLKRGLAGFIEHVIGRRDEA